MSTIILSLTLHYWLNKDHEGKADFREKKKKDLGKRPQIKGCVVSSDLTLQTGIQQFFLGVLRITLKDQILACRRSRMESGQNDRHGSRTVKPGIGKMRRLYPVQSLTTCACGWVPRGCGTQTTILSIWQTDNESATFTRRCKIRTRSVINGAKPSPAVCALMPRIKVKKQKTKQKTHSK